MKRFKLFWLLVVSTHLLVAHQTGLSYLKLTRDNNNSSIFAIYKKPLEDSQAKPIEINLPSKCLKESSQEITIENGFIIEQYRIKCLGNTLIDSRIWVDGLVSSDKGILLEYSEDGFRQQNLLRSSRPFALIERKRDSLEISLEYIGLGFAHILSGTDHLLFLFALLLLVPNLRTLLYSITAFTISHSIALALSTLDIVVTPVPFIEAMIALSILILYREVIIDDHNSLGRRYLPWMVLFFGLLHGMGFATVLGEIGLPPYDIPTALLAFNIGIELGQLLFVSSILILHTIIYFISGSLYIKLLDSIKIYLSYILGGVSTFWFIERVVSF